MESLFGRGPEAGWDDGERRGRAEGRAEGREEIWEERGDRGSTGCELCMLGFVVNGKGEVGEEEFVLGGGESVHKPGTPTTGTRG